MNRALIAKADGLLSRERGTVYKEPGGKITACLVYPNSYFVGMSNLGFQGIYGLLNGYADVVCERAFLPEPQDLEKHLKTGTPIFSLESKRPLNDFDILAFSISFENDYPSVLRMLDLGGVPRLPFQRGRFHPLVIAGGACCFFNPEPFAQFFDLLFLGESEDSLAEFLNVYRGAAGRADLKEKAAWIEGVYAPEFYEVQYDDEGMIAGRRALRDVPVTLKRRVYRDVSRSPVRTSIVTDGTEFSNMYLAEVMRGCPWSCRFCVVSRIYHPPRKKDPAALKSDIDRARQFKARVGLVGPSLSDYPHLREILSIDDVSFSITSLRATPESGDIIEFLKGRRSVSIAPEAGTERMRMIINKQVTEQDILETASRLFNAGIGTLRLYFMVGLPFEEPEDTEGIVRLVMRVKDLSATGSVVASVSTFVPKPFTPFQWHPMEAVSSARGKVRHIKKALRDVRGVKVLHDLPKYAGMQGLFSRGDRRVGKVLVEMTETDDWAKASVRAGVDPDFYILRPRSFDETLPWDFIDIGIPKERLWQDYLKALELSKRDRDA